MDAGRRYENTLVALLFLTWGTVFLDRMSELYLAPFLIPEFQLTNAQVGLLASALAITWAISSLVFGAISGRVGRRPILIPAVFTFSLLSWMSGMVHSYHQLLLVRAMMGIAEGPAWCIMTAVIEESSHPSRSGRNVGLVVSALALVGLAVALVTLVGELVGATAAPVLGGAMAESRGLAFTPWLAAAGMGLAFLAALFLKKTPRLGEDLAALHLEGAH